MQRIAALAMMVASGFAALGYQVVWTRQASTWLGHEGVAVMAVVAAFFGGLALGAFVLGRRIERSAHPGRWFAIGEAVIGAWAALLIVGLPGAGEWLMTLTGADPSPAQQWAVAFVGIGVVLLPATVAMGATLPAMERALAAARPGGRVLPLLYAANTFGALLGVLASAFWLVPSLGLARSAALCVACNLLCAVLAWRLLRQTPAPEAPALHEASRRPRRAAALLTVTGLLGIGYELVAVRVLSQVTENTVYSFTLLLAVYLVGTSIGAALYQRFSGASRPAGATRDRLLLMLAGACLLGVIAMGQAGAMHAAWTRGAGGGMAAALAGEALLAVAAFALPTVAMGALFCHLCLQARDAGLGFGTSLAFNTLGGALAGPVFGALLLPLAGSQAALLLIVAGYLALLSLPRWLTPPAWAVASVALLLALALPRMSHVDVPEGGRLVSHVEGPLATVSVVEDGDGIRRLHINNRQQEGSSATLWADGRQALLPLLLHPNPRDALFLGLGTGVTAGVAARDRSLQVEAVELLPEVVAAASWFRDAADAPALRVRVADARRQVRAGTHAYDLVVADNFHPARSGSASLYTVEHFEAVRSRLAPGGIFVQWLPLHQLDPETLRSIVASFLVAFPQGRALLATNSLETPVLGLVGGPGAGAFERHATADRLHRLAAQVPLADFGLPDEWAVLGSFVAGAPELASWSRGAPLNTDDRPIVAYLAPRVTYAPDASPRQRLAVLLAQWQTDPVRLAAGMLDGDAAGRARLAAYLAARNRFLAVGQDVQPSPDVRRMLAQVRGPLQEVLRLSPDFRPAYDPLVAMAQALAKSDARAARGLLEELRELQPMRPEAPRLLERIAAAP